jgi:hypothetical protein
MLNIIKIYVDILGMRKKKQKGGVIIVNKDAEKSINFFIENCKSINWLEATGYSASGVIFECNLNDDVESPYEMIRSNDFKSPVKTIIIKLVGIDSEVIDPKSEHAENKKWDIHELPSKMFVSKKLEQEESFKNEINIQTDIFLNTVEYLNPLCPAPIYASIEKDKIKAQEFIDKMIVHATGWSINALRGISKNLQSSIPYLGILGMEIAEGYKSFYKILYHSGMKKEKIRNYENMLRLKIIDLALKTGYSQGDFHSGNLLVNPSIFTGYYNGIIGNVIIIDFGYASKIPRDTLQMIKELVSENKYVEALKLFYTLQRSDGLQLNEFPSYYGWLSYDYDNLTGKQTLLSPEDVFNENLKLISLKEAEELATSARIAFYNSDENKDDRDKYPLLPLPKGIRNSLFEGLITGGRKNNKTRSRRKRGSYTKRIKRR